METKNDKGFVFKDKRKVRLEDIDKSEQKNEAQAISNEEQEEAAKEYEKVSRSQDDKERPLPKVDFSTFVFSLASSALVHLGEVKDPVTGQVSTNLQLARQIIDTLGMIEEKTRGNLNEAEENLLKSLLYDLRIKFVQKVS